MRKLFHSVLAAVLAVSMLTFPATALAENRPITVLLNGGVLTTEAFVDENNRTQIPAEVARKVGVTREYTPGSAVDDTVAVEGYVPLRAAFTEAGYTVDWDSKTGNVLLGAPAPAQGPVSELKAPDYSQKASWYQLPEITKDVDTFYIYSTAYIESSFNEGAPDYAPLDNLEMLLGAMGEYTTNASVCRITVRLACGTRGRSGRRPGTSTRRSPVSPMRTCAPRWTTTLKTATMGVRSLSRVIARVQLWSNMC